MDAWSLHCVILLDTTYERVSVFKVNVCSAFNQPWLYDAWSFLLQQPCLVASCWPLHNTCTMHIAHAMTTDRWSRLRLVWWCWADNVQATSHSVWPKKLLVGLWLLVLIFIETQGKCFVLFQNKQYNIIAYCLVFWTATWSKAKGRNHWSHDRAPHNYFLPVCLSVRRLKVTVFDLGT